MINDHLLQNKSDFRSLCKERLAKIAFQSGYKRKKTIVKNLYNLIESLQAKEILLYIPFKAMEVDVKPLIKELRKKKNINVYVPFMQGESFIPVPYRLPINKKRFGIKEPNISYKKTKIDLAVVPIVGLDAQGKRIGFGAGMYDRFFDRIDYEPTIVFTQLQLMYTPYKLCDHYDIQGHYLITH